MARASFRHRAASARATLMAVSMRALVRRAVRPDTSVGAGILVSRLAGLLRVRLIAR